MVIQYTVTHTAQEILDNPDKFIESREVVSVAGRLMAKRRHRHKQVSVTL